jgi:hypothetical protein
MLAPPLGYDPGQRVLRCWRDAGNDKSLVGLWPFWRDTIAAGVKTKWSSHRRRPSGDLEPLESLGFPYQVSLTIAVNVEPLYHALPSAARPGRRERVETGRSMATQFPVADPQSCCLNQEICNGQSSGQNLE